MKPSFTRRDDAVIDVNLGPGLHWFTEALLDAVTTRAPRGSDDMNPSTYWIDRTLSAVAACGAFDDRVVASGNAWELRLASGKVSARSQYSDADEWDEHMSLADFQAVLTQWRQAVLEERRRERP